MYSDVGGEYTPNLAELAVSQCYCQLSVRVERRMDSSDRSFRDAYHGGKQALPEMEASHFPLSPLLCLDSVW